MNKKMMPIMIGMIIIVLSGFFFAWQGVVMQNKVAGEEVRFHALQAEYWSISKVERDAAATGSALNAQLVEIENFPSSLLELKLVGIGKILTGIFLILFSIFLALVMAMPMRLAKIIKRERQG